MSFDRLGLSPELLRAVAHQGYTEPTPVQTEAIPLVLAGRDVLAGAQTGTGKTAAFVLPMLQRLHASRPAGGPRVIRALILTPTRELALQVEESVRTYGAQNPIRSTTIYGGVGFDPQVRALRAGPEIVVATPGRLLDHVGQRTIDLSRVEILVLDEADRMLDMGFIRDIRKILAVLPPRRQNLLFSATFSDEIRRLADGLLDDPASVQVTPRNTPTELVTQVVHLVDRERKRELLSHLIKTGRIDQALVFTRTKHGANRLATAARARRHRGHRDPRQQEPAAARPRAGRLQGRPVRGPRRDRGRRRAASTSRRSRTSSTSSCRWSPRTTSTGSAGPAARASTATPSRWCASTSCELLRDIERVLGRGIPRETIPGFEPDPRIRPEPILRGGLGGARPQGRSGAGAPRTPVRHATAERPVQAVVHDRWAPRARSGPRARRELRQGPALHDTEPDRGPAAGHARAARVPAIAAPASPVRAGRDRASAMAPARVRPRVVSAPVPGPAATGPRDPTVAAAATASHARRMRAP